LLGWFISGHRQIIKNSLFTKSRSHAPHEYELSFAGLTRQGSGFKNGKKLWSLHGEHVTRLYLGPSVVAQFSSSFVIH